MLKALKVIILFIFFASNLIGQNLKIDLKTSNYSKKIKNGTAELHVTGGQEPYTYKWSDKNTSLHSFIADGLTEGSEYKVVVTDANGIKDSINFVIPAESADEKINSFFVPLVAGLEKVLMFDIFKALHLYNPVLHDDKGNILKYPNGDTKTMTIPFVVIWLIFGALFFTVKMKFINFRGFKHAIQLIRGIYDKPKDAGEVSHFQALTTALSATVGLGNIAGVAIAVTLGGPGATFWMIIAGLLGMASKFTEVTLGVKYRNIDEDGRVAGGPMY